MTMTDRQSVPTLRLTGSLEQIGAAHGEACREKIHYLFELRRDIVLREIPGLQSSALNSVCQDLWDYLAHRHSSLAAEASATARSAKVKPWQLVLAGAYTDVMDICRTGTRCKPAVDECTVAIDADRHVIAGTWDSHPGAVEGLLLLARLPDGGPATLALTTAGWPAQQGVNDRGLAFAITNLTPRTASRSGLVYIAANALLAEADGVDSFLQFASRERFCSGHSYLAVGRRGPGMVIDTASKGIDQTSVSGLVVKANHYRDDSPLDRNTAYPYLSGSRVRAGELQKLLVDIGEPQDFGALLATSEIVNRADPNAPGVTSAHFYLDPDKGEVWYRPGPATGTPLLRAAL